MKYKIIIPAFIIAAILAFFAFRKSGFGGVSDSQNEVIQKTIMGIIGQGHYSPRELNNNFSQAAYDKIIEALDYEKKFLLANDVHKLSQYRNDLDNQIRENSLEFFDQLNQIFTERIKEAEQYYINALKQPFDFSKKEEYETDSKKLSFVYSKNEMQKRWNAAVKYRVLTKYYELEKEQNQKIKDSASYIVKSEQEILKSAISSIEKAQIRYFKRLNKLNDNDRFAIYMNGITNTQDPHTVFMQPTDRKRFDEMMSGSFIGIGATLQQEDDGRIKITSIVTGSPSWKQGGLKVDDIIEKVAQDGAEPVDVVGYELDEVVKMIRGPEGTKVNLHVVKKDASKDVITIVRGKVDLDYIRAKSTIIEEEGKKIGYINLPEFYADFNGLSGRRSGVDVEKEVNKLMDEKVDGIVLDLRNNGGGSLSDVVDIVGLFVGSGPVVQIRAQGDKTTTLRAKRSAPLYTGPLAIMINNYSASASEILAAAIQDYRRGIIIGNQTFGKGTVQKLVPLDNFVSSADRKMILDNLNKSKDKPADFDGIGSLKITIQKFYRINGGSTQLKGVVPDIVLPNAFEFLDELGESSEKSALAWDKITPANYQTFYGESGFTLLNNNSKARIAVNENFKLIQATAKRVKERKDNSSISLQKEKFFAKMKEGDDLNKKLELLDSLSTGLTVRNLNVDYKQATIDEAAKENNEKWLKGLRKDPYLKETANIMSDVISGRVDLAAK